MPRGPEICRGIPAGPWACHNGAMRAILVSVGAIRRPTMGERVVAFAVRWAVLTLAVWVAAWLVDGIVLQGWKSTVLVALILGLLNAILKPLLFWVSLPVTVLTLGLFLLLINTGLLALTAWIAGQFDGIQFAIDGFWAAFLGALIISVVSWVMGWFVKPEDVARNVAR